MGINLNWDTHAKQWRLVIVEDRKRYRKFLGRNKQVARDLYKKFLIRYYLNTLKRALDDISHSPNQSETMAKYGFGDMDQITSDFKKAYKV